MADTEDLGGVCGSRSSLKPWPRGPLALRPQEITIRAGLSLLRRPELPVH